MGRFKSAKKKQQQKKLEKQQKELEQQQNSNEPQIEKKVKKTAQEFDIGRFFTNPMFESYYKTVLAEEFKNDEEFNNFWNTMKEKLPVTFRVCPNFINHESFKNKLLQGKDYLKQIIEQEQQEQEKLQQQQMENEDEQQQEIKKQKAIASHNVIADIDQVNLFPVPFVPEQLAFQLDVTKSQLKKGQVLKKFHTIVQQAADAGLVTRQEFVSMIPPLLLNPEPQDQVFDMCAAPGSKTSQLLEMMNNKAKKQGKEMTGCVLANDMDTNRAYMLTHQIDRLSTSGMMVVNHHAQFFPNITIDEHLSAENEKKQKLYFDKVLCDVPCTGDGATRKIPKKFLDWNTRSFYALFQVQLTILMRAIQVCKVGGYVMYSTCSISPIEDEAVVLEAFRRALPNSIELVDCHERLPHFKGRKGIYKWPVLVSKLNKKSMPEKTTEQLNELTFDQMFVEIKKDEINNISNEIKATDNQYSMLKEGMFPESEETMKKIGMEKTMRVLPHDQNTGGFYLALIRKKTAKVFVQGQKFDASKIDPNAPIESAQQQEQNLEDDIETIKEVDPKAHQEISEPKMPAHKRAQEKEALKQKQKEQALQQQLDEQKTEEQKQQEKQNNDNKQEQEQEQQKNQQKVEKIEKFETYQQIGEQDFQTICNDYGLQGLSQSNLLINIKGVQKVVKLVTPTVAKILKSEKIGSLNVVNLGSKAFRREIRTEGGEQFLFRLCNDGIRDIFPYMTKRTLKIELEDFLEIIGRNNIKFSDIKNQEFVKKLKEFGQGALAMYFEHNGKTDVVAAQIFASSVQPMISKETVDGYKVIYEK